MSQHFIIIGRTSDAIADGILRDFAGIDTLTINEPLNVFQARFGTFGDGESIFELFVDGKLPDHPVEQNLSETQKQEIERNLRGAHVTIAHSVSGDHTSSRANSLLDGVYDLKSHYGVASITQIGPHLPYMRNDRRFTRHIRNEFGQAVEVSQRNAISGRHFARRLHAEGVDRVVGIEPHSRDAVAHYRDYFSDNAAFLPCGDFFAGSIANDYRLIDDEGAPQLIVGSPDGLNKPNDFGIARAKRFARALYRGTGVDIPNSNSSVRQFPFMFGIHKDRESAVQTSVVEFSGNVDGRDTIIIDDIISSGNTNIKAAIALREHGARHVETLATHGVLVDDALERLIESPLIDKIRLTDTIPSALEKWRRAGSHPKVVFETVAPLVVQEIHRDRNLMLRQSTPARRFDAA